MWRNPAEDRAMVAEIDMRALVPLEIFSLVGQVNKQLRQSGDVLDPVKNSPGSMGEILQQPQILKVGTNPDSRDRNSVLGIVRHFLIVIVILTVSISIGQQDHLTHGKTALVDFMFGDFKCFLEIGSAARFEPLDARDEFVTLLGQWTQMAEDIWLRIKRDHSSIVSVVELVQ